MLWRIVGLGNIVICETRVYRFNTTQLARLRSRPRILDDGATFNRESRLLDHESKITLGRRVSTASRPSLHSTRICGEGYAISPEHPIERVRKREGEEEGKKRNTSRGKRVGKRWLLTDREGRSVRIALRNRIASHAGGRGGCRSQGRRQEGWDSNPGRAAPLVRRGMATRSAFTVRVQPFISIVRRIDTRHRPYPSIIRCGQWSLAPPYTRL